MRSYITLSVLAAIVSSQTLVPSSVPLGTRQSWCTSQKAACPLLCLQTSTSDATRSNTCDATTLDYSCVCINGISPNASDYSQTIPYYVCTQDNDQCVTNCGLANNACSAACRDDNPCGAQNPTRVNTSTISTSTGTSATGTGTAGSATTTGYSAFGGAGGGSTATSTSTAKTGTAIALSLGHTYGLAVIAGGMFAGFALML